MEEEKYSPANPYKLAPERKGISSKNERRKSALSGLPDKAIPKGNKSSVSKGRKGTMFIADPNSFSNQLAKNLKVSEFEDKISLQVP
jgi:hypothetical protein